MNYVAHWFGGFLSKDSCQPSPLLWPVMYPQMQTLHRKEIENNAYCKTAKLPTMHYGHKYQQQSKIGNPVYTVSSSVCGVDLFPTASFPPASPKSQISLFLHLVTQGHLLTGIIILLCANRR